MKIIKNNICIVISALLVLLTTLFIFYNSSKSNEASHNDSQFFSEIISGNSVKTAVKTVNEPFVFSIRKIAHLIEFAALGISVICLILSIKQKIGKAFFGSGLFYVLAVAVADEYLQTFSGRSSSINDILLDFTGAVIGFLLTLILVFIVKYIKHFFKTSTPKKG